MGQKKSNFDHLNLGNSIFTGFNDKEGLMICGCEWGFSKRDQIDWENGTYEKAKDVMHTFADKTPAFGKKANTWPYDNNIKKWFKLWEVPLDCTGLGGAFEKSIIQTNWANTDGHNMGGSQKTKQKLLNKEQVDNFISHIEALRPKLILFFGRDLIDCLQERTVLPRFEQIMGQCIQPLKCVQKPSKYRRFRVFFQEFEHCKIVCLPHASGARGLADDYIALFKPEMAEILNSYKMQRNF